MKNSHRHDLFAPWTSSTHSGHGHTMKYRIVRGGGSELAGRPSSSGRGAVLLPSVTRPPTREKTRSEMWSRPAAAASPPLPPTNAGFLSELEKKEHSHRRLLLMSEAVERRRLPPPVVLATKAASLGRCSSASGPTPSASSAGISRETSLPRSTGRFARSGGSLRGIDTCISSDPDDLWRDDDARTLQLVESLKYTKAYLAVSALLPSYTHHTAHLAVLRARRASCSYALMNYRECIEDCQLCIQCWRDASIISGGGAGHIIDGLDLVAVIRFWARSLLMREEYGEAEYLLNRLTSGSAASGPMESMLPQIGPTPQHEFVELCGCLPAVEAFRSNITAEDWSTALAFVKDAMPVIGDSPLRTLHAIALLELGQVDPVREMLLPYLPQIPTPFGEGEDISPEDRQLHSNMDGHYLLATILLAKASAYSGRPYMNISAELTKRCLQYNPRYAPAIAVGNYLVLMEDYLAQIDECFSLGSFDAAVALISEAMRLDSTNHRIQAHLLHRRAEAAMALRRPINTIDDCTHSLNLDPGGAATYMLRAHAYDAVQRHCEAAADRARAVELNPSYEAVLREEDEARRRRAAEEAAREQQRKQQKQRLFEQQQQQRQAQQQQQQQQREAAAARAPKTLYDVLGLPRTAHVTEIRARFKQLTLQCHPDKVVSRPLGEQQTALETFKSVNNAYAILSDADKRSEYDRTLATP